MSEEESEAATAKREEEIEATMDQLSAYVRSRSPNALPHALALP